MPSGCGRKSLRPYTLSALGVRLRVVVLFYVHDRYALVIKKQIKWAKVWKNEMYCIYLQRKAVRTAKRSLKGNRVQLPDSPAAVSSKKSRRTMHMCKVTATPKKVRVGRPFITDRVSQKTCRICYKAKLSSRKGRNCECRRTVESFPDITILVITHWTVSQK
jgi:hypothetical protein